MIFTQGSHAEQFQARFGRELIDPKKRLRWPGRHSRAHRKGASIAWGVGWPRHSTLGEAVSNPGRIPEAEHAGHGVPSLYQERPVTGLRTTMIVALARKPLITLWHFVRCGVIHEGIT